MCLKSTLDDPAVQALRQILQSAAWQRQLQSISGCTPAAWRRRAVAARSAAMVDVLPERSPHDPRQTRQTGTPAIPAGPTDGLAKPISQPGHRPWVREALADVGLQLETWPRPVRAWHGLRPTSPSGISRNGGAGGQIGIRYSTHCRTAAAIDPRNRPAQLGALWLKTDSELPISGSIKRGGIYEVLRHAEDLAFVIGTASQRRHVRSAGVGSGPVFSAVQSCRGSTGNLGPSIGIMVRNWAFRPRHMSSDARQWKKDRLRAAWRNGDEYDADYSVAVTAGRRAAAHDPHCHFVDDETRATSSLGYAGGGRTPGCPIGPGPVIAVDADHPYSFTCHPVAAWVADPARWPWPEVGIQVTPVHCSLPSPPFTRHVPGVATPACTTRICITGLWH